MTVDGLGGFAALRDRVQAEMMRRLPDHLARLHLDARGIATRQRDGLRALLRHAIARSPFHARRLAGLDVGRIELDELHRLPVMTKADLMEHFDDVLTDRRLGRALCERALAATGDEPCPLFGEYFCLASGGSSGQRGVFVLDLHALVEFLCSLNRTTMEQMLAQGGPPPGGLVIAMVAAASAVHATGCAPALTEGGPARIIGVPVTLPLAEIVARLDQLGAPVLYGYPSMLARLARETEQRDQMTTIRNCGDHLLSVINDVLDFSKIEAGKMPIASVDFDIRSVVEEVAEVLAQQAQDKGFELVCDVPPGLARHLRGDPARLRQVIFNLTNNAIKFTEKGEVVIQVRAVRETPAGVLLRLAVRDTGMGIPVDRQQAIFESFTQVDGSTTRKHGGTGLGLTICRQLVQLMGSCAGS